MSAAATAYVAMGVVPFRANRSIAAWPRGSIAPPAQRLVASGSARPSYVTISSALATRSVRPSGGSRAATSSRGSGASASRRWCPRRSHRCRWRRAIPAAPRPGDRPRSPGPSRSCEPALQVVADAERVGHDGQRRVHRGARRKEATVDHVEIVHLVSLAVGVERRGPRVVAEPDRPVLVRDAGERDPLAQEKITREEALVAVVAVHATFRLPRPQALELRDQPALRP